MGKWVKHRDGKYEWKPSREERSKALRYKKPALESLEFELITNELWEIREMCVNIHYMEEDEEELMTILESNGESLYEFRMLFSDLEQKAEELGEMIYNNSGIDEDEFNDCMTGLIGNRYTLIGYDDVQEDYFSMTSYQQELAFTEAGKRFMRMTKAEMLSRIGQCMGITLAYLDLRQQYDYLKATFDILRDDHLSILNVIKDIEETYLEANAEEFYQYGKATQKLNKLVQMIPDKIWVE